MWGATVQELLVRCGSCAKIRTVSTVNSRERHSAAGQLHHMRQLLWCAATNGDPEDYHGPGVDVAAVTNRCLVDGFANTASDARDAGAANASIHAQAIRPSNTPPEAAQQPEEPGRRSPQNDAAVGFVSDSLPGGTNSEKSRANAVASRSASGAGSGSVAVDKHVSNDLADEEDESEVVRGARQMQLQGFITAAELDQIVEKDRLFRMALPSAPLSPPTNTSVQPSAPGKPSKPRLVRVVTDGTQAGLVLTWEPPPELQGGVSAQYELQLGFRFLGEWRTLGGG